MRHYINPLDLSLAELDDILKLGQDISQNISKYSEICKGKILATLFFEPSTRTRLSFESAMLRMGGTVLGFSSADSSSAAKGESVADTIRMISSYADVCAMRHPSEGAPKRAGLFSTIPVINAGDGSHQHPTQTLTDLMTVLGRKKRLSNLKIGFCGDLKYGRTVHSLMAALSRYEGNTFELISPENLRVPQRYVENARNLGVECHEHTNLDDIIPSLDILYMTRIQKERFVDENKFDKLKDCYILDAKKMSHAKKDMAVLHPLPRVNEITLDVDNDDRAAYFEQAQNGVYVRMALMITLLGFAPSGKLCEKACGDENTISGEHCANRRCITNAENDTKPLYAKSENNVYKCIYCESDMI